MSRVAKTPITIPVGVHVSIDNEIVNVKGKLGQMNLNLHPLVKINQQDNILVFSINETKEKIKVIKSAWAQAGTARANINNCITGVSQGFEKKLKLIGVGYRAKAQAKKLELLLGYSHPINYQIPEGITIMTPSQTEVIVSGYDKQKVGQVAAEIRAYRTPEPYKGKGVCYADEQVFRKEAKKK